MPRQNYDDVTLHCLICATPVPPERLRFKAITCSEECATIRKNMIRAKHDASACRYCRKPSTNEERAAYQRFRKLEKKRPDLLYPVEWKAFVEFSEAAYKDWPQADREKKLTPESFYKYIAALAEIPPQKEEDQ